MDKPQQPQGNFVISLNFKRNSNPKAPPITGRISTPEDPETEFNFSAFEHTDKNGESYWIGPVDMNRSMRQALNTEAQQGTNFVAIRENGFKVFKDDHKGQPNPAYAKLTPAEQAHEDSKSAYWASWTRTEAEPQLRASAWEQDASRYGPWASGNTQHPLTKEQAAALKAGKPDAAVLNAPEPRAATPRRAKAEGRDQA
ncbi:MAG: hypothetical protein ABL907_07415 [Hyphomicrobium sp.]